MNGRLTKIFMKSRLLRIKEGIHNTSWYPERDETGRWAALLALHNALDILDEYEY